MSEEKKGFFSTALSKSLSAANGVVGNKPSKKVGTGVALGGVGYGLITGDYVGGAIGLGAGLVIREHERLESLARTLDFFVANVIAAREEAKENS